MHNHEATAMMWWGDLEKGLKLYRRKYGPPTTVYCRGHFPILEGKEQVNVHGVSVIADNSGPNNLYVICGDANDYRP